MPGTLSHPLWQAAASCLMFPEPLLNRLGTAVLAPVAAVALAAAVAAVVVLVMNSLLLLTGLPIQPPLRQWSNSGNHT